MSNKTIEMYARLAAALVSAVVLGAKQLGFNLPIVDDNAVAAVVTLVLTVGSLGWAVWKNNDITKTAQAKTQMLEQYLERLQAFEDEYGSEAIGGTDD